MERHPQPFLIVGTDGPKSSPVEEDMDTSPPKAVEKKPVVVPAAPVKVQSIVTPKVEKTVSTDQSTLFPVHLSEKELIELKNISEAQFNSKYINRSFGSRKLDIAGREDKIMRDSRGNPLMLGPHVPLTYARYNAIYALKVRIANGSEDYSLREIDADPQLSTYVLELSKTLRKQGVSRVPRADREDNDFERKHLSKAQLAIVTKILPDYIPSIGEFDELTDSELLQLKAKNADNLRFYENSRFGTNDLPLAGLDQDDYIRDSDGNPFTFGPHVFLTPRINGYLRDAKDFSSSKEIEKIKLNPHYSVWADLTNRALANRGYRDLPPFEDEDVYVANPHHKAPANNVYPFKKPPQEGPPLVFKEGRTKTLQDLSDKQLGALRAIPNGEFEEYKNTGIGNELIRGIRLDKVLVNDKQEKMYLGPFVPLTVHLNNQVYWAKEALLKNTEIRQIDTNSQFSVYMDELKRMHAVRNLEFLEKPEEERMIPNVRYAFLNGRGVERDH